MDSPKDGRKDCMSQGSFEGLGAIRVVLFPFGRVFGEKYGARFAHLFWMHV